MKSVFRVMERGNIHKKIVFPDPPTEIRISRNRKLLRMRSNHRTVFRKTERLENSVLNIV